MPTPIVELKNVCKAYDKRNVLNQINLQVHSGEFLTLLGPSGCGKTTLLKLIAGFEQTDSGVIYIAEKKVNSLPPQRRDVHMIFQRYALFPHLTVFENVAFSLHCRKLSKKEINQRVQKTLEMIKLLEFSEYKPQQLSGGQQQRIAIARAVINKPSVLLLDEPLNALDYELRKSMQIELRSLQRQLGITFILVTHDQEEALSISDRIAVLNKGKIEQLGTPREIYEDPINITVAKFIGDLNIFETQIQQANYKHIVVHIENVKIMLSNEKKFSVGEMIYVLIRPEDLRVWDETEIDGSSHMLPGHVKEIIYKGSTVDLVVQLRSGKLIFATEFFDEDDEDLEYKIGEKVWVDWVQDWEVLLGITP